MILDADCGEGVGDARGVAMMLLLLTTGEG